MAKISVVIPCYNHGEYIDEAVESIRFEHHDVFETIIVNDGSTDDFTIGRLKELEAKGHCVIHQENKGLAMARNAGISLAKGKYILPLDSDNKIIPGVFAEAASVMDRDDSIDVVFTDALYMGSKEGVWKNKQSSVRNLLLDNNIDACALIRRKTLVDLGMYDGGMPMMGTEDWELWIRMYLNKKQFFYLPKAGFHYRVAGNSMMSRFTNDTFEQNRQYIYHKHATLIAKEIKDLAASNKKMRRKIDRVNNLPFTKRLGLLIKLLFGKKLL